MTIQSEGTHGLETSSINTLIQEIAQRMSLRIPQKKSLEVLAEICDILPLVKVKDNNLVVSLIRC